MTNKTARPSPIAPLGGVVVGIAVFLGVNITSGWAIIPTAASVKNHGRSPLPPPAYPVTKAPTATGPVGPYQTVCATCHQAEGQGMPGAFPPLAGSEWMTGNPEVPIRIVLAGLTGPVDVKGTTYNALMPPPAGMTDEQIAEAISYARTHFGNTGSTVDVAQVRKVRADLGGRSTPFTAAELKPLLSAGDVEPAPAEGAAGAAAPAATAGAAAAAPPPAAGGAGAADPAAGGAAAPSTP